jgi:hypothetical protein
MSTKKTHTPFTLITLILPGSDRKRSPAPYYYRTIYRNPDPTEVGCVVTWEIFGGREDYQISLERTESRDLVWHCSCPDAVYRDEKVKGHRCKHVQGLQGVFEPVYTPSCRLSAAA